MNRKIFGYVLCFLILGGSWGWGRDITTITDRRGSTDGANYYNGNDIYVDYDSNSTLEGGGCMWLYTGSSDAKASFWDNNVFLKGYGLIRSTDSQLENTGALRFGLGGQSYTTPVVLTGDVTLLADASIGVEVNNNCNLHAYITGEIKTSGEAAGETFTLRKDATSDIRGGTLVIVNDNASLTANWDIRKGVVQVGAVDVNFTAKGYEWFGEPETYTQNTAKSFAFDGTTGGLGTGNVEIASPATLKYARSNDYTISNAISGAGKIVFSGGGHGTLTSSIANTITSIEIEAGTTFQANHGAVTNSITGTGFYQIHFSGEKAQTSPTTTNLTGFSGVLLTSGDNRWRIGANPDGSYAIGAIDYAQIWVTGNVDISKDLYLSGIGWSSNERFGALRLAGAVSENSNGGLNMSHVTGNVTLLGDTRIGVRENANATTGMISGKITGDYTLSTGGDVSGTLILTGENSYGNTHVVGTTTLQIGHIGKINGNKTFDGTQGTLGTGSVAIDGGATLKFVRSNDYAISNAISGTGKIVFSGGGHGTLTGSIGNTITSIEIAAGTTFQANHGAVTNSITGAGFYQIHFSDEKMQVNPTTATKFTNFSGVLLASGDNRWGIHSNPGNSYAIGAIDNAQLWANQNIDISTNLYLSGIGWSSNERFGALRLAGLVEENKTDGGLNMPHITGDVTFLGDTRISARYLPGTPTMGMISGNITGDYTLSTGKDNDMAGTLILTGENSYGKTHVVGTTTLQIGHIGKINNNKVFDGTQGTLGTGSVAIDSGATLKFVRTDTLAVGNKITGSGSIVLDGGGNYSWTGDTADFTGSWNLTNGTWAVGENQSFAQAITVGENGELAGTGTVGNVTMAGGKVHSTLTFTQDDFTLNGTWAAMLGERSFPTVFDGSVEILSDSTLEIALEEDFYPEFGDSFFLLAGDNTSFQGLDLESILVSTTLPDGQYWALGIGEYGDGLGLYAQVSVPEPSSWLLILAGCAGIWGWRRRKN